MAADPNLAATALLDRIPSVVRALADARSDADHWRVGLEWAAVGVALILVLQSRLLARIRDRLGAEAGRGALAPLICAVVMVVLIEAARMLATALADAIWSRGAFASDFMAAISNIFVEALLGGLCLWALLCIRRRWPRFGWVGVSVPATVLIFAAVLVPPVTLLPTVRGDRPASGPNAAPILAFVRSGGLDTRMLYVFDGADPLAVDMEGLGSIAHAAVSRGALAAPTAETYAAIGHLLGHYRNHDLYRLAALWSAVFAAFCWAVWAFGRRLERRSDQAAPTSALDANALPMVGLIGWAVLLLATPAFNAFDQAINYRADDYALQQTRDPDGLCRWLMIDEAGGKADPPPLETLLFYDHPPLKNRLVNALRWKAAQS